jgi:hypothetical protein
MSDMSSCLQWLIDIEKDGIICVFCICVIRLCRHGVRILLL